MSGYEFLVRQPNGKKRFGKLRRKWEDDIKRDHIINSVATCAQDTPCLAWGLVNMAMTFHAPDTERFVYLSNTSLSWIQFTGDRSRLSPDLCLFTDSARTVDFARATPIFVSLTNARKRPHLRSLFLTFKLKQGLPIFHSGMTSRERSADSTGIDPVGRQETQTDADHEIRGATLMQQADSVCEGNTIVSQRAPQHINRGNPVAEGLCPQG
jgi:hypothetical protein